MFNFQFLKCIFNIKSFEQEGFSGFFALDINLSGVEGDEETGDGSYESWCVEVFVEAVEVALCCDSGEEDVVASGDDGRGRFKSSGESVDVFEICEL